MLREWSRRAALGLIAVPLGRAAPGDTRLKIPRMQAVPLPYDKISFQREEREIARFHFGERLNRPFVYPMIGPSHRSVTRMGHPGDPYSHSHHNSVWISYSSVNGVDFWSDHRTDRGRIVVREVLDIFDGDDRAGVLTKGVWMDSTGLELVHESRETWAYPLENEEWMLVLDLTLDAVGGNVTFEKSGFGPIGVRMAKWIAVHFGDGRVINSAGGNGEPATFRKPARWMDYSGSVARGVTEGVTLMDHSRNVGHPSPFHVREDGWMGAMLSTERPIVVARGTPLHLRYGLYVHGGAPGAAQLDRRWDHFDKLDLHPPFGPPRLERDCLHGGHRRYNAPRSFGTTQQCLDYVKAKR